MSDAVCIQMTPSHGFPLLARIRDTLTLWRQREWERASLLLFEDRDLHDLGMSRGEAAYEANKPFWRA